ncbi:FecR family protein [Jejudonia soesokkakensis]|uniref:FecR family protein n=1 Tax=Jejudonia soesokkakensis TaxID=1323432 RepID=A0ABW2MYB2_9FLAO
MEKNYLLHKYLNNEATAAEIELLQNDSEYKRYIEIADSTSRFDTPVFNEKANFEAISSKLTSATKVRKLHPLSTALKIAAVLVVLVMGYLFISNLDTKVETAIAENKSVVLPDTSEVILNSNSQMTYKKKNWEENRSLTLQGEAFFKVAKGKQFDVETALGHVRVLGTQFNVFSRDRNFRVYCYEGLVEVHIGEQKIQLPAGHSLKWSGGIITTSTNTDAQSPSWTEEESSFENDSLSFVLKELERQYKVTVDASKVTTSIKFTGSFTHTNLEIALRSICEPLQIEYTIDDSNILLNEKESR